MNLIRLNNEDKTLAVKRGPYQTLFSQQYVERWTPVCPSHLSAGSSIFISSCLPKTWFCTFPVCFLAQNRTLWLLSLLPSTGTGICSFSLQVSTLSCFPAQGLSTVARCSLLSFLPANISMTDCCILSTGVRAKVLSWYCQCHWPGRVDVKLAPS